MRKTLKMLGIVLIVMVFATPGVWGQGSEATRLLRARTAEFDQAVITVTEGVYTAVGYSVSTVSMVVGDNGIIIVDTGLDTISAKKVLADFRKISDKPVKAIILTHAHGDHTGGVSVFAGNNKPQIWACANFGSEAHPLEQAGLTIQRVRGARQGGFMLPPAKRINNGVAKAYWPKRGGAVFGSEKAWKPTHLLSQARQQIEVAGVKLDLVAVNGETTDALYVWLPAKGVLFAGDNFYKSWPNLYAIRGTMYRDIRAWANTVDMMIQEKPDYLVGGHTRPIIGGEKINEVMTNYRDAIRFVFDKTIEGMNKGMTPDALVDYVKLPSRLAEKDYLREYYGNVQWAVRQIFNAHLGWFDGNPTNLFSLSPKEEAIRMAQLAGGEDKLLQQAKLAINSNDHQWAAQLADYLIALSPRSVSENPVVGPRASGLVTGKDGEAGDIGVYRRCSRTQSSRETSRSKPDRILRQAPSTAEPKLIKAHALEALAENLLTATGRNYYLTVAQALRAATTNANSPSELDQRVRTQEAQEEANKRAAMAFFQCLMGDLNYEEARKYTAEYIQHDPLLGDGFDALAEALQTYPQWKNRKPSKIDFKLVAADGDLVTFQIHKTKIEADGSKLRIAVVHTFRFNNHGKIAEHWTVVGTADPEKSVSKHPLF